MSAKLQKGFKSDRTESRTPNMPRWNEQKINNKAWNTHRHKENATSAACVKKLQKLPSKVKSKKAGPRACKGGTSKRNQKRSMEHAKA